MCAWFEMDPDAARPDAAQPDAARRATRRQLLQLAAGLCLGSVLLPGEGAWASEERLFAAGTLEDMLRALGGQPQSGTELSVGVPDLVENGALVPVEVTSHLAGAQTLYVIAEANPYPMVARFNVPEGTDPYLATRIKVAQSCNIYAVVRSGEQLYWAAKATQVTIGGCGG